MKKAIYKVPQGKLLKIFLEDDNGAIKSIHITGDFFMHPEENIEKLEAALCAAELNEAALKKKCAKFFSENPTKLFGIDVDSLILTILTAS